jgi:hypothetical protein
MEPEIRFVSILLTTSLEIYTVTTHTSPTFTYAIYRLIYEIKRSVSSSSSTIVSILYGSAVEISLPFEISCHFFPPLLAF